MSAATTPYRFPRVWFSISSGIDRLAVHGALTVLHPLHLLIHCEPTMAFCGRTGHSVYSVLCSLATARVESGAGDWTRSVWRQRFSGSGSGEDGERLQSLLCFGASISHNSDY